jgi:hypothetical protein
MKILRCVALVSLALFLGGGVSIAASPKKEKKRVATLMPGLGEVHHPVSTKSKQAQQFFDQGLKLIYGFNHDEARLAFERAAQIDPQLAMAWWGVALTLGPNYNLPVDPEREKAGYEAAQKAVALKEHASDAERAYIDAIATRYSNESNPDLPALDRAYKEAMATVVARFPDDLDAATLYAESAMNLRPWQLWTPDGKPAEGTDEIVSVLESVLKRDPNHLGANHYYIHAVEASPNPEKALAAANRLQKLAPSAGHLTHMPAHIYARVGDHAASANSNRLAADADKRYLVATGVEGVYPMMYYSHNLHFLAYAGCMRGDFVEAKAAAAKLIANVAPHVKMMADLEGFMPTDTMVLLAFERWNDILKSPKPEATMLNTTVIWHFARGIAFANLGKPEEAEKELAAGRETVAKVSPEAKFDQLNKAVDVLKVPDKLLVGAIAQSRKDYSGAIAALTEAVTADDALNYSEPPPWYPPVRPALAKVLLTDKKADGAEKVLRADLDRNPRDARALAGLRDALKAQGKEYEAAQIERQYQTVWKAAATGMALSR